MSNDLHIYLKSKPTLTEIGNVLSLFGFEATSNYKADSMVEPDCYYWRWDQPPLSGTGFRLLYFDGMFRDNLHADKFKAFTVLEGAHDSSPVDLHMIDITASLLLRRYGGVLHNPQRADRKHPNVYLCGKNNTKA